MIDFEVVQKELKDYDENVFEKMEEKSAGYIEHFKEKSKCTLKIKDNDYVLICPIGDQHMGNDSTDYQMLRKDAEMIGNCEYAIAINASDTIDNFINAKILEAIINSSCTPKQEIKMMQQYFEMFKGKMIISISGNHENWSKKSTGIDWLAEFMKKNSIVYNRDEIRIYIEINGQKYSGKLRHKVKNKSMYNKTHGLKQNQRFYSEEIFDFIIGAHYHEAALEQSRNFGIVQTLIQTGTYKITDPYAYECGYGFSYPDMPCFIIDPFQHNIINLFSIENGIKVVNALNNSKQKEVMKNGTGIRKAKKQVKKAL
jgi:hypothetical protein